MGIAANVLTSRLRQRLREDLAIVYSVGAQHAPTWVYDDSSQFQTGAPCAPENADKVIAEANKIFAEFAEKGPTDEELANAKKHIANALDTELREPGRWFGILRQLDLRERSLGPEKTIRDDYQAYTVEQVRDTFRKYCTPARMFSVTAIPTGEAKK